MCPPSTSHRRMLTRKYLTDNTSCTLTYTKQMDPNEIKGRKRSRKPQKQSIVGQGSSSTTSAYRLPTVREWALEHLEPGGTHTGRVVAALEPGQYMNWTLYTGLFRCPVYETDKRFEGMDAFMGLIQEKGSDLLVTVRRRGRFIVFHFYAEEDAGKPTIWEYLPSLGYVTDAF